MGVSRRLAPFGVTIFTEMTSLAARHGAINLGQGFPDWDGPGFAKEAAAESMRDGGHDQYPPSMGVRILREAVAHRYGVWLGRDLDVDEEVTITSGATEALASSLLGLVDEGDEVVVIEPFYDSYPVDIALTGAVARYVTLRPPDFRIDPDDLRSAFSHATRAILVNTPHNPTGRVFDADELSLIASLCREFDAVAICDDVYEEIVFEGAHHRLAALDGMWDRTVTVSSVGKTYSLTGWKVGWVVAPPHLTAGIRAAHQYLTFTTPTPVQHGAAAALGAPSSFYDELRQGYLRRRDLLAEGVAAAGFDVYRPAGTYFLMAGYGSLSAEDDRTFVRRLIQEAGVVAIPPSVFFHRPQDGHGMVRFAFCKEEEVLGEAVERLARLRPPQH